MSPHDQPLRKQLEPSNRGRQCFEGFKVVQISSRWINQDGCQNFHEGSTTAQISVKFRVGVMYVKGSQGGGSGGWAPQARMSKLKCLKIIFMLPIKLLKTSSFLPESILFNSSSHSCVSISYPYCTQTRFVTQSPAMKLLPWK